MPCTPTMQRAERKPDMALQTRGVLAGAYKGKRTALDKTHTHLVDTADASGGFDALCGKVKPGNMADEYAGDDLKAEPTCPHCVKLLRAFEKQGFHL